MFGYEPLFVAGQFPSYDSPDSSGYAYSGMRFIRDELFRTHFFVRGANVATAEPLMFRTGPRQIDDELWLGSECRAATTEFRERAILGR